jgi:eukaryotic-like serine/threonine-protein kinase
MAGDDFLTGTLPSGLQAADGARGAVDREVRPGEVLGSYQLERLLGEGSMGRVFQARHTRLGRQVALKVLRPAFARDAGFVQRFFQEARSVNDINHEHIVEIFDFVEEARGGHVYCVMELLRGRSLAALLQEEVLSLPRIRRIAVQVCAALGAAHRLGVVHRDVKPDNLFLIQRSGESDFVKVLDFGVAKVLNAEGTQGTLEGAIVGTPTYMSPEQAAGLPVDVRADIYAVGTVLYEMLAGHPPFLAPSFGQLVVKVITEAPPPLPSRLSSGEPLPPALARLTLRCLAKEPEQRPQRLEEVLAALWEGAEPGPARGAEDRRPTLPVPVPVPRPGRGRGWLGAAGGALALLVGGLALWPEAEPAPSPSRPAALAPVTLTVRTTPEGARVVRSDTGEALGVTPLVTELPRRAEPLGLRVELAGHEPLEREVRLDSHAVLELPLVPVPPPAVVPSRRKAGMRDAVIDPFAR